MTMTAISVGPQQYKKIYPSCVTSARSVRADVRLVLQTWSLDHLAEDAMQVVSELMANAVEHTGTTEIPARIVRTGSRRVRLEVTDRSNKPPQVKRHTADDERGRGMAMIEMLSLEWGWERIFGGKSVWAEIG